MHYRLDWAELSTVAQLGMLRNIKGLSKGYPDRAGFDSSGGAGWGIHIEGAAGEYVVSKALGVAHEPGITNFREGADLAGFIDVKTTARRENGLILTPRSIPELAYVLVVGSSPEFTIMGWAWGSDVKQSKYYRTIKAGRPKAFSMPIEDLRPLIELRRHVIERKLEELEELEEVQHG